MPRADAADLVRRMDGRHRLPTALRRVDTLARNEGAALLPEGQQLDSLLLSAISDAVPEGAMFGFNGRAETGETWIHVFGPGGSLGREVSREVLNTALISLGRPGLSG